MTELTKEQLEADRRVLLKIVRGEELEGAHDFAGCSDEVLQELRRGPPGAMKVRGFVTGLLGGLADGLEKLQIVAEKVAAEKPSPAPPANGHRPPRHERRRRR
jgi:hypothetical protein